MVDILLVVGILVVGILVVVTVLEETVLEETILVDTMVDTLVVDTLEGPITHDAPPPQHVPPQSPLQLSPPPYESRSLEYLFYYGSW